MDKLEFDDIIQGLKTREEKLAYIIQGLETGEIKPAYIIQGLEKKELNFSEDEIIKIIEQLTDRQKVRIALNCLKSDSSRMEVIDKIVEKNGGNKESKALVFPIKISLSREGFKKYFLREKNKKYDKIGLDKGITIGVEIETIGESSGKILEVGEKNGKIIHKEKDIECGKIVKRRKG